MSRDDRYHLWMPNILTELALLNNDSSNSAFFVKHNLTVQQNMKMHSFELKTFMFKHSLTGKPKGNHLGSTSLQNCNKSLNLIVGNLTTGNFNALTWSTPFPTVHTHGHVSPSISPAHPTLSSASSRLLIPAAGPRQISSPSNSDLLTSLNYPWRNVRNFHGIVLGMMEQGELNWDDTSNIQQLRQQYAGLPHVPTVPITPDLTPCTKYQTEQCTQAGPHDKLAHICAWCYRYKGKAFGHPQSKCMSEEQREKNSEGGK